MSTIEFAALDAIGKAVEDQYGSVSFSDALTLIRNLDENGWQLTRKPEPIAVPAPVEAMMIRPQTAASEPLTPNSTTWPPSGITKLWATDFVPDRSAFVQIESVFELQRFVERGASLIEALSESDARYAWKQSDEKPDASFVSNNVRYQYQSDLIPF